MIEKLLTLGSIVSGTLLTYLAGTDIYYGYADGVLLGMYTTGLLLLSTGVRSLIKGMEYRNDN